MLIIFSVIHLWSAVLCISTHQKLLFWLMLCIAGINRELITFLLSTRPVLIINSPFTNWCLQERERERGKEGRGKEKGRER